MRIGTRSKPVEGRDFACHWRKAGNMGGFASARSMALGRSEPAKRKRV